MPEQTDRDGRALARRVEAFLRRWAPADPQERAEFETQLLMLTRQIFVDADGPAQRTLNRLLDVMTPWGLATRLPSITSDPPANKG